MISSPSALTGWLISSPSSRLLAWTPRRYVGELTPEILTINSRGISWVEIAFPADSRRLMNLISPGLPPKSAASKNRSIAGFRCSNILGSRSTRSSTTRILILSCLKISSSFEAIITPILSSPLRGFPRPTKTRSPSPLRDLLSTSLRAFFQLILFGYDKAGVC